MRAGIVAAGTGLALLAGMAAAAPATAAPATDWYRLSTHDTPQDCADEGAAGRYRGDYERYWCEDFVGYNVLWVDRDGCRPFVCLFDPRAGG